MIRLLILMAFVVGMPCLAIPRVLERAAENSPAEAPTVTGADGEIKGDRPAVGEPRANDAAPAAAHADVNIDVMRNRLQLLGATYFRLEQADSKRFHFTCEMELPGSTAFRKRFDAEGPHPEEAIRRVLGQVEQWHVAAGRARRRRE